MSGTRRTYYLCKYHQGQVLALAPGGGGQALRLGEARGPSGEARTVVGAELSALNDLHSCLKRVLF